MRIEPKQMTALRAGDIVAGHMGGWWVITCITTHGSEVTCTAKNYNDGLPGSINGHLDDFRDCLTEDDEDSEQCSHQDLSHIEIDWVDGEMTISARCLDCGADLSS